MEGSQVTSLGSKSENQEIEWKLIAKNEYERDRTANFNGVAESRVVVDPTQLLVFQRARYNLICKVVFLFNS